MRVGNSRVSEELVPMLRISAAAHAHPGQKQVVPEGMAEREVVGCFGQIGRGV